jgi:hypothetical protein
MRSHPELRTAPRRRTVSLVCLAVAALAFCPFHRARSAGLLGSLNVTTDPPGARVYVNGRPMGTSPCRLNAIGIGLVEVKAEAQGYRDATETVDVKGDATVDVSLSLKPLANVGALDVRVTPDDALVEMDRLPVGRTPALVLNVAAGTHGLRMSAEGYRPLLLTVTVAPDQRQIVDGRLVPIEDEGSPGAADDLSALGKLVPEDIPPLSELVEDRTFEPVRRLVRQRDYEGALEALAALTEGGASQSYALRIGRDRRVVRRIREVVEAGSAELAHAIGQDYVLLLRGGIRLTGRLMDVKDGGALIALPGGDRRIGLDTLSAAQVVRLASVTMPSDMPAHMVSFALLHAAEGEFDESYGYLRRAAETGYSIASARSYVDAEHVWDAAVQKDRAERRAQAAAGNGLQFPRLQDVGPVTFLVDTYRGRMPPQEFRDILSENGVEPQILAGAFGSKAAEEPAVLVIFDRGGSDPVPRYDRQELQLLLDFVQRGGSLLFVGAQRPVVRQPSGEPPALLAHPFDPLLRWYGITVRRDRTELVKDAPDGYPDQYVIGVPAPAHPLAAGVRSFVVSMGAPTLAVQNPAWVAVRADGFVTSAPEGAPSLPLVAGRAVGQGCVVVMSAWPTFATTRRPGTPLFANDAELLVRNALAWLARSAQVAAARTG